MNGISKISVTEEVALMTFNNIPRDLGLISNIMQDFSAKGINIDMISQSAPVGTQANVSFTVDSEDLVKALEVANRFREKNPSIRPLVSNGNCKIQLYGEEMRETPGVASNVFQIVSHISSEVMLITTSEVDISILIAQHDMNEVLTALQEAFSVK